MEKRLYVGNPVEGYVTDEVSRVPTELANLTHEFREKFVTDLAAVSRGKDESKNPSARFKALLKEAAPNSKEEIVEGFEGCPSRPLEFLPIIAEFKQLMDYQSKGLYWAMVDSWEFDENYVADLDMHLAGPRFTQVEFFNKILRFSYSTSADWDDEAIIVYSNARTFLNAGFRYSELPTIGKINYRQYGNHKDDLHIVMGGERVSVYEINVDYDTVKHESNTALVFDAKRLLEAGYTVQQISDDFRLNHCYVDNRYSKFKAIKLKVPLFAWAQWPMTHTQLSKESQSDRVAEGVGYWLPEDIIDKINNTPEEEIDKIDYESDFEKLKAITSSGAPNIKADLISIFTKILPQDSVQQILKASGYKREIWSRAPYYFKYKECVVVGWYNDPTTWQHSFLERSVEPDSWKNWTQKETKEVLRAVKEIIERK